MNQYTLLDEDGAVAGEFNGSLEDLLLNLRPGQAYVNGPAAGDAWNGKAWEMRPPPPQQQIVTAWTDVRAKRDALLGATDWRVTRAMELGELLPLEWQAYRQALRDITQQPDPENIHWPQLPTVEG